MEQDKTKTYSNAYLHYRYIISYLFSAIILLMALDHYDIPELVDKLSFALTLSSILLAVLAIFYTIISGHKQDSQFSKLIETNSELKSASNEIKYVSERMNTLLKEVPTNIEDLRCKLDGGFSKLHEAFSFQLNQTASQDDHKSIIKPAEMSAEEFRKLFSTLQFAGMGVLLIYNKAYMNDSEITFSFLDEHFNSTYFIGFLAGFQATGLVEFKIITGSIIPIRCDKIIRQNVSLNFDTAVKTITDDEHKDLLLHYSNIADKI